MKMLIGAAALFGVLAGAALLWATTLPETTVVTRTAELAAPVDRVFALVTDIPGQRRWRSDVGEIVAGPGQSSWVERTRDGDAITFREEGRLPNQLFAITYQSSRGFSGRWVGEFEQRGEATLLRIEERTTVPNPVARLVARLLAPPGSHADLYLADLRRAVSGG